MKNVDKHPLNCSSWNIPNNVKHWVPPIKFSRTERSDINILLSLRWHVRETSGYLVTTVSKSKSIHKYILHYQNHINWIDGISIFWKHSNGLGNLVSNLSLYTSNTEFGSRNKGLNEELCLTMWPVARICFAMDELEFLLTSWSFKKVQQHWQL